MVLEVAVVLEVARTVEKRDRNGRNCTIENVLGVFEDHIAAPSKENDCAEE